MLTDLNELLKLFVALAGFAALAAVLVDIAKRFGLPDGSAPTASLVINLIGFVLFVIANIFGFDTAGIDKILAGVASVLTALLGLLGQLMVSRGVHAGLRGTLFSYSRSRSHS